MENAGRKTERKPKPNILMSRFNKDSGNFYSSNLLVNTPKSGFINRKLCKLVIF